MTDESRANVSAEALNRLRALVEFGERSTPNEGSGIMVGLFDLRDALAEISRLRADRPSKELISEMAKQASLGHKRFCVGVHEHEGGELEYEWINWTDAFRRISEVG